MEEEWGHSFSVGICLYTEGFVQRLLDWKDGCQSKSVQWGNC